MYSHKLELWYREAYEENGIYPTEINRAYAIFPKRMYSLMTQPKMFDFAFIGGLHTDPETFDNRRWILSFIQSYFGKESYLQFTDSITKNNYIAMGEFDHTLFKKGFVPKEVPISDRNYFDENYYSVLQKSRFCLCPAGDALWSMRFYEAIICRCIPIVNSIEETYRTEEESKLDYKFYLTSSGSFIYREDWVEHNYQLFLTYHTLHYEDIRV
jgi:hypothetical protein